MGQCLIVTVPSNGMITTEGGNIVHRETRHLHEREVTYTFTSAKRVRLDDECILTLTDEGGGCEIWVDPSHLDKTTRRVMRWKGCYGAWPIKTLS